MLSKVLTGERYRLLKHVHAHPEPSISALARALGRQYRRVHAVSPRGKPRGFSPVTRERSGPRRTV